jgi:very-short-patch-repair endonuclease
MASEYASERAQESCEGRLTKLAAAQHGVFSRDQAMYSGVNDSRIQRRLAAGRWERVHAGVYRVAGTPATWRQSLIAACLMNPAVVVSHRSAAALWKLSGFAPGPLEVIVSRSQGRKQFAGFIAHRLSPLAPADITELDGIRVTSPARTLIDIASVASSDIAEEALDDALRRRLVSIDRLRWRISELGRSGRPGISRMRALLAERDPRVSVPQSVFETRLLRLLRRADLPKPVLQHRVSSGAFVAVVDFAFPSLRIAVEAEGYRWHSGKLRWEHDLARRNALTALGWRVIHVSWKELIENPETLIEEIRQILDEVGNQRR